MLDWLSDCATSFSIQHNAHLATNPHRDVALTLDDHIRQLRRTGSAIEMCHPNAYKDCIAADELWEVRATFDDGQELHLAGPTLNSCVAAIRNRIGHLPSELAA